MATQDEINNTFITACSENNLSELKKAILAGADINHLDGLGFLYACKAGYLNILKELVAHGVEFYDDPVYLCHEITKNDQLEIAQYLVEKFNIDTNVFYLNSYCNQIGPKIEAWSTQYKNMKKLNEQLEIILPHKSEVSSHKVKV